MILNEPINEVNEEENVNEESNPEETVEEETAVEESAPEETVDEETAVEESIPEETVKEASKEEPVKVRDYLSSEILEVREVKEEDLVDTNQEEKFYLNQDLVVNLSKNNIVTGSVASISDRDVFVDIGFKTEGIVPLTEFKNPPIIGKELEVVVERFEDKKGNLLLSKEKADFVKRWSVIKEAYEKEETVTGVIARRIKGGMVVDLDVIQAFLPGSQIDIKPVTDFDEYRQLTKRTLRSHVEAEPITGVNKLDCPFVDRICETVIERGESYRGVSAMINGYFEDMLAVMNNLAKSLSQGAMVAMVIGCSRWSGVVVPTDLLVAHHALESENYLLKSVDVVRYKGNAPQQMAKWGRYPVRESVIVLERI